MTIEYPLTGSYVLDDAFNNSNSDNTSRKKLLYTIALWSIFILSTVIAVWKIFMLLTYINLQCHSQIDIFSLYNYISLSRSISIFAN